MLVAFGSKRDPVRIQGVSHGVPPLTLHYDCTFRYYSDTAPFSVRRVRDRGARPPGLRSRATTLRHLYPGCRVTYDAHISSFGPPKPSAS
jgi:hypothetical protein